VKQLNCSTELYDICKLCKTGYLSGVSTLEEYCLVKYSFEIKITIRTIIFSELESLWLNLKCRHSLAPYSKKYE